MRGGGFHFISASCLWISGESFTYLSLSWFSFCRPFWIVLLAHECVLCSVTFPQQGFRFRCERHHGSRGYTRGSATRDHCQGRETKENGADMRRRCLPIPVLERRKRGNPAAKLKTTHLSAVCPCTLMFFLIKQFGGKNIRLSVEAISRVAVGRTLSKHVHVSPSTGPQRFSGTPSPTATIVSESAGPRPELELL